MCRPAQNMRAVLFLLLLCPAVLSATSVRQLDFDSLLTTSSLVFEGEVLELESQWNDTRAYIYTSVRFKVKDVLKGDWTESNLELRFAGGTVGEDRQEFEAMIYPAIGEQGVYFVEDVEKLMVHPLVGWSQGHFKVIEVDGQQRMYTATGYPVASVVEAGGQTSKHSSAQQKLSEGHVRGMELGFDGRTALTPEQFKGTVIERLQSERE